MSYAPRMLSMQTVEALYRRHGDPRSVDEWIDALPTRYERLVDAWALSMTTVLPGSLTGLVVAAEQDGRPVVVKIAYDAPAIDQEAAALVHWAPAEVVPAVYERVPGAYLMERVGAPWTGPDALVLDALDLLLECPSVVGVFPCAHAQLARTLTRYAEDPDPGCPAAAQDILRARTRLAALPVEGTVLVHADLHDRALLTRDGRPILIDPMAARARAGFDAGVFAAKHDAIRCAERVAAWGTRHPEQSAYVEAISRIVAVQQVLVRYRHRLPTDPVATQASLAWARG